MKLTNQQIDAIVSDQTVKFNSIQAAKREEKKKNQELNIRAQGISKHLMQVDKDIRDQLLLSYYGNPTPDVILNLLVNKKFKKKHFDTTSLRNKIIIASIDAKNLAELTKKLNLK